MKTEIWRQRISKVTLTRDHNIFGVTENLFTNRGYHIYLWPKATRHTNSQNTVKIVIIWSVKEMPQSWLIKRAGSRGRGECSRPCQLWTCRARVSQNLEQSSVFTISISWISNHFLFLTWSFCKLGRKKELVFG